MLPFLAEHLGTAIGMAGWLVGFVLGLRTFSRQGLFVVGGRLVDRHGVRPVVPAGCVLRIVGFAWLGYAESSRAVVGAVLVIGFAAALFSPAVESEVARQAVIWEREGRGPRTRVLALFSAAGQAGAFVGPLLGGLLPAVDFRTACLAGAEVFVLVLAGHARLMPQHIPGRTRTRQRGGVRVRPGNRRFLALCCAYGSYLLAYSGWPPENPRGSRSATAEARPTSSSSSATRIHGLREAYGSWNAIRTSRRRARSSVWEGRVTSSPRSRSCRRRPGACARSRRAAAAGRAVRRGCR